MTQPTPTPDNPFPSRPWPCTQPITVPVKPCCHGIGGDACRCACQQTKDRIELDTVMAAPILFGPVREDPALEAWRPGPDMAEQMSPPLRWHIGPAGLEVSL